MRKTLYIPIDTTLDNIFECPKLIKRGDTLTLVIKVFTNAVLANLTGQSIDLILKKADATLIEKTIDTSNVANGVITAILDKQATLAQGVVSGEVQLYTNDTLASTNTFTFVVDASLADDVLEVSQNDIEVLADLKNLISSGQATILQYENSVLAIGNSVEAVEALANIKAYIDINLPSLESANAQAVVNIANETTQNNQATQNITDLTSKNATATSNISSLDSKNATATENISALDNENTIATNNISSLDSKNATATENISALDSKNDISSTNISNLETGNIRAEANIEAMENFGDVTLLTQTVQNVKTEVETARNGSINLDVRLGGMDSSILTNTQNITNNTNSINAINNSLSNLNANDLSARQEIMQLKAKMDISGTSGIGFYDTFADDSYIDATGTTATYDSTNKEVDFTGSQVLKMTDETFDIFNNLDLCLYPKTINKVTVSGNVDNSYTVVLSTTDKTLSIGDKLFMNNLLNEVVNTVPNYTTYDRTTPISVVNSAYTTSATARPQKLSNGWIVTAEYDSTNAQIKFNISKDEGTTWNQLCYYNCGSATWNFSIASYGTMIYFVLTSTAGTGLYFLKFDATSQTNVGLPFTALYEGTGNGSGCSIAVSSTGILTIAWSSKNSSYPNSSNILSIKSNNSGTTWTKQDGTSGVDQLTTGNSSGVNSITPYVVYDKNDKPVICYAYQHTTAWQIKNINWTGTEWIAYIIYNSGSNSYTQSNPVATLQKYGANAGRIWVTWHGLDSTDTTRNNIKVSYSDDNESTWSIPTKLTSGNTYHQYLPCISSDINGNVYVMWHGLTYSSATYYNIRMVKFNGTSWGSITEITSQNINNMEAVSTCDNFYNFEQPLSIWKDSTNNRVAFYGKWTVGQGYTLTMQNPVTLTDSQKVPIVDLMPRLNGNDLTISNIDSEKFVFKGSNLNTTNANITVNGKDNSLESLVYAIA